MEAVCPSGTFICFFDTLILFFLVPLSLLPSPNLIFLPSLPPVHFSYAIDRRSTASWRPDAAIVLLPVAAEAQQLKSADRWVHALYELSSWTERDKRRKYRDALGCWRKTETVGSWDTPGNGDTCLEGRRDPRMLSNNGSRPCVTRHVWTCCVEWCGTTTELPPPPPPPTHPSSTPVHFAKSTR